MELNELDGNDEIKGFAKALNKCRTCNHQMLAHFKNPKISCLDAKLTNQGIYARCNCKLFIPIDNLEFLEWVTQQKEKKA
jgi:hypothetical protein